MMAMAARSGCWRVRWVRFCLRPLCWVARCTAALQSEALKSAIAQNGKAREGLRNFQSVQELFGDVGDGLDLAQRLREWEPDGRYGWVFGEAKEPVADFTSHDVAAVDLTETLDLGTERTAILGYLFRRIEMRIEESARLSF